MPIPPGRYALDAHTRHAASDFHAPEETARWTPTGMLRLAGAHISGVPTCADGAGWHAKLLAGHPTGVLRKTGILQVLKQAFEEEPGIRAAADLLDVRSPSLYGSHREGKADDLKNFKYAQDKACVEQHRKFSGILTVIQLSGA